VDDEVGQEKRVTVEVSPEGFINFQLPLTPWQRQKWNEYRKAVRAYPGWLRPTFEENMEFLTYLQVTDETHTS
jgi:hypothetical protein